MRYAKNGLVFQTSLATPDYPLVLQAAFIPIGGSIDNAILASGSMADTGEWSMYQHDAAHTAYCVESSLDTTNIPRLREAWKFNTGGMVTGTPIVSGGVVYAGSWDGNMYALNERTGAELWRFNAGTIPVGPCSTTYGIDNTAALSEGKALLRRCELHTVRAESR